MIFNAHSNKIRTSFLVRMESNSLSLGLLLCQENFKESWKDREDSSLWVWRRAQERERETEKFLKGRAIGWSEAPVLLLLSDWICSLFTIIPVTLLRPPSFVTTVNWWLFSNSFGFTSWIPCNFASKDMSSIVYYYIIYLLLLLLYYRVPIPCRWLICYYFIGIHRDMLLALKRSIERNASLYCIHGLNAWNEEASYQWTHRYAFLLLYLLPFEFCLHCSLDDRTHSKLLFLAP